MAFGSPLVAGCLGGLKGICGLRELSRGGHHGNIESCPGSTYRAAGAETEGYSIQNACDAGFPAKLSVAAGLARRRTLLTNGNVLISGGGTPVICPPLSALSRARSRSRARSCTNGPQQPCEPKSHSCIRDKHAGVLCLVPSWLQNLVIAATRAGCSVAPCRQFPLRLANKHVTHFGN